MRAVIATILIVACAWLVLGARPALAEETRRICARATTLRDTPRGFAIGRLYRRQKVIVVRRSAARGWLPVRTTSGLPGWILAGSLCRG